MTRRLFQALGLILLLLVNSSYAQQVILPHPGLVRYTPTRIDWLTTVLQASLRTELSAQNGFLLQITTPDPETILIYVRYLPNVNRKVMNSAIDTARKVIRITAKSYGWNSWLKIKEDVKVASTARQR